MHGWRGRWVDHYAKIDNRPEFWYQKIFGYDPTVAEDQRGEKQEKQEKKEKQEKQEDRKAVKKDNKSNSEEAEKGPIFSAEDDEILLKYADAIVNAEDDLEAWEDLQAKVGLVITLQLSLPIGQLVLIVSSTQNDPMAKTFPNTHSS
jgi:hypothetical protein